LTHSAILSGFPLLLPFLLPLLVAAFGCRFARLSSVCQTALTDSLFTSHYSPFTLELAISPESSLNLQGGRFQKGQSGNPMDRPKGSRNKTTLMAEAIINGHAEALVKKVVQLALEGDLTCLRICLERLVPMKKDAPFEIDLPDISTVANLPKLFAVLTAKLREGITPSEARTVMDLAQGVLKVLEVAELEQRISALEEKEKSMNV
jgi:hypothetical protein